MVMSQPHTELHPSGASCAGSWKMPEPMNVPTTSARAIQNPSFRSAAVLPVTKDVSQVATAVATAGRSMLGADRARRCEMVLHHGHRRRRIPRGQTVATARLGPEFGDILLVIVDHIAADLTIESTAVEVAQKERLTPRLWR